MPEWHYVEAGEQRGPIAEEDLLTRFHDGTLGKNTLVWSEGMTDWDSAASVPSLAAAFAVATVAPPPLPPRVPAPPSAPSLVINVPGPPTPYAGFGARCVAYIIDYFLLSAFTIPVVIIMFLMIGAGVAISGDAEDGTAVVIMFFFAILLLVVLQWLFYALFESSRFRGTPGKIVMQIKVATLDDQPIGFGRATVRHFSKLFSALPLFLGFVMAAVTKRKQALHDMMSGCLVLNTNYISEAIISEQHIEPELQVTSEEVSEELESVQLNEQPRDDTVHDEDGGL